MASAIDPTKPVDGIPAVKADLRTNLGHAKTEIGHGGFFTQSGTGAVERTVAAKLQDSLSAKDFGLDPNGGTDDTAKWALLVAEAASSGRAIYFPAGNYQILTGMGATWLTQPVSIIGDGRMQVTITGTSGFLARTHSSVRMSGFTLTGGLATAVLEDVAGLSIEEWVIEHVGIIGANFGIYANMGSANWPTTKIAKILLRDIYAEACSTRVAEFNCAFDRADAERVFCRNCEGAGLIKFGEDTGTASQSNYWHRFSFSHCHSFNTSAVTKQTRAFVGYGTYGYIHDCSVKNITGASNTDHTAFYTKCKYLMAHDLIAENVDSQADGALLFKGDETGAIDKSGWAQVHDCRVINCGRSIRCNYNNNIVHHNYVEGLVAGATAFSPMISMTGADNYAIGNIIKDIASPGGFGGIYMNGGDGWMLGNIIENINCSAGDFFGLRIENGHSFFRRNEFRDVNAPGGKRAIHAFLSSGGPTDQDAIVENNSFHRVNGANVLFQRASGLNFRLARMTGNVSTEAIAVVNPTSVTTKLYHGNIGLTNDAFTVATVPAASLLGTGAVIYVSNGAAGQPTLAFSDGTNWLRADTGAAISAS